MVTARRDPKLCVQCRRRPVDPAWRPFCSERCKLLDLGDWLGERYRVPGAPARQRTRLVAGAKTESCVPNTRTRIPPLDALGAP